MARWICFRCLRSGIAAVLGEDLSFPEDDGDNESRQLTGILQRMIKNIFKILLFIFPVFFISIFAAIRFSSPGFCRSLVAEDGFFEIAQVFLYLSAAAFFLVASRLFFTKGTKVFALIYLALSLGLALVCAEEISWGQRIMALESPGFFDRHNVQRELTIHNLSVFQPLLHLGYILTGMAGAVGWLAALISGKSRWGNAVPPWYISTYFLPVIFVYLYFELSYHLGGIMSATGFSVSGQLISWRDQEMAELLLAAGFFLFSCSVLKRAQLFIPSRNKSRT